jgi:hypothetical protein
MVTSVCKFGVTLAIEGWSSMTNRPLFNAMMVTSAAEQFFGIVDTMGYQMTMQYQASIIEEVGPYNVVQSCTDNVSSMKAAADIITYKYLYISFHGCALHAMNFLLEDWKNVT